MSEWQSIGVGGTALFGAGKILYVLQIALIFHVIKTGRPYWWIFLLLSLPLVGALIYFVVEILPGGGGFDARELLWRLKSPAQRLAALQETVEEVDTVENRVKLAHECVQQGKAAEAGTVLQACLRGPFQDDTYVLLEYAAALVGAGQFARAGEVLAPIKPGFDRPVLWRQQMLQARVLEGLGKLPEAATLYGALALEMSSEEPRYRHGCLLLAQGHKDQARDLFLQITRKYRKNGALWRRHQKDWFRLTRARLKEIGR